MRYLQMMRIAKISVAMVLVARSVEVSSQQLPTEGFSTPPGVTLVYAEDDVPGIPPERLWTRLGDEQGRALYVCAANERDASLCQAAAAEALGLTAFLAGKEAQAYEDWSLVGVAGDGRQWAYQGQPLYRYVRETQLNEIVDQEVAQVVEARGDGEAERRRKQDASIEAVFAPRARKMVRPPRAKTLSDLKLPPGWQVARFHPAGSRDPRPAEILIADIAVVSALGFVTREGVPIYAYGGQVRDFGNECSEACRHWQPLLVGELTQAVGKFTVITLEGGEKQWAYRGFPLFTWKGDVQAGDVNGTRLAVNLEREAQPREPWFIPVLAQHFVPASVIVRRDVAWGEILSNAEGLPLYVRNPIERSVATRMRFSYRRGKEVGLRGCDELCLQTWRPLSAPASASSRGFWEVVPRPDGTRQWAYQGFVQYTNSSDRPGGRATGHNTYDYVIGESGRYRASESLTTTLAVANPAGFYWSLSAP